MAFNFKRFFAGIKIVPKTTPTADSKGDLEVIDSTGKLNYHNGTSVSPMVTEAHTATLTNKTIDADVNTISDLEVDNLKAGVLNTDPGLSGATDTQIPSALAAQSYTDGVMLVHLSDPTDAHDASAISNVPSGNLAATDVQSALNELQSDIDTRATSTDLANHAADTSTHGISSTIVGISETQTLTNKTIDGDDNTVSDLALTSLKTNLTDASKFLVRDASGIVVSNTKAVPAGVVVGTTDSQALTSKTIVVASNTITTAASGNLTSTELNAALAELQSDIDTRVTGPASATNESFARFDGTTGKLVKDGTGTITSAGAVAGLTGLVSSGLVQLTGTTQINNLTATVTNAETVTNDSSSTGSGVELDASVSPIVRLSNASLVSVSTISGGSGGRAFTIINQTGTTISINNDTGATASNRILTGTGAAISLADQASILLKFDATETRWMVIGGTGSGSTSGINYILASDGSTTTGWATYSDAAQAFPENGTGGTATGITFASSTSSPLRGASSFLFSKDAANRQGKGVSYDFTIASADQAQLQVINFEYNTSANYADGDVRVYVYDVTNSVVIDVTNRDLAATSFGKYVGQFQTSSNSTSYRLIFHVASTNATAYDVKIDTVEVGPKILIRGAVATDSISYTPTLSDSTNVLTNTASYKRVGETMEISGYVEWNGTGAGTTFTVSIPSGFNIDTSKLSGGSANTNLGNATWNDASVSYKSLNCRRSGTTAVSFYELGTNNIFDGSQTATGDYIAYKFSVPILGWSSNMTLSEDVGNRIIAARLSLSGNQTISSVSETTVTFDQASFDTASGFTLASNGYTIPESGYYDIGYGLRLDSVTADESYIIRIKSNGSTLRSISNSEPGTATRFTTGTYMGSFSKGDILTVTVDSAADASYTVTASATTYLEVAKRSSPQTMFYEKFLFGSTQRFTASGTWTKPNGCRAIMVEAVGSGGGGGGAPTTAAGQSSVGSGGAAGGYAKVWIENPSSSVSVTINAAGTGSAGADGSAGGSVIFGSYITANGGGAGLAGTAASTAGIVAGGSGGSTSLSGTTSTFNTSSGQNGSYGYRLGSSSIAISGTGGSSFLGMGGPQRHASTAAGAGLDARGFGGGGGGAVNGSTGNAGVAGGDGSTGIVIIYEYY